MNGIENFPWQS